LHYSILALARNALTGHRHWPRAWRSPALRDEYDVVIIGGGGHGLATAYYLARDFDVGRIAVLERGWIGGGNTGRNTAVVRSNYLRDVSVRLQEAALRLWPDVSRELNFNVMMSPRGQMEIIQTWGKLRDARRRVHTMRLEDAAYELVSIDDVYRRVPHLNRSPTMRLPVLGGAWQPTAGIVRHDAVAWGFARAADAMDVAIVQDCEVTGIDRDGGRVTGVRTSQGTVRARKVAIAVAGQSGVLAAMAGLRLPVETVPLQAFVSEPMQPLLDCVVTAPALGLYFSQSARGELVVGGGTDAYPSYVQRGSWQVVEETVAGMVEMFPILGRVKMMRQWAGVIDLAYDTSPILSRTDVAGLYVSTGWGSGGFKTIPIAGREFAALIATDTASDLIAPFGLDRFTTGRLVLETASASNRM